MDRISKALEMARKNSTPPPAYGAGGERRRAQTDLPPIRYTMTQQQDVPERILRRGRVTAGIRDERVTDAYRRLRTRVLHRMRQNGWTTLGVTSAAPREGKTLTAVNLGVSIAMSQKYSVLVVDADLRRPSVHSLFGLRPKAGLVDHVLDDIPVESLLINPGIDRLVLLPGNPLRRASSEPLGSQRMENLLDQVRNRYSNRIVIFDLPPVLVGDDVIAFAPKLDALLLVVEEGSTERDAFARTIELLDGVDVVGTVLNKSGDVSQSYGDYYYY